MVGKNLPSQDGTPLLRSYSRGPTTQSLEEGIAARRDLSGAKAAPPRSTLIR